ncbi:hypothetical protein NL455_28300, partial [Klebsiella pneumoniae]|nr:hypothetical protein [Klebsiella pneumoniae]
MTATHRQLSPETARLLTLDTEPWLSCEDCFAGMDHFVEAILSQPGTAAFPEMRAHVAGCPACAEEVESLLALVAEQDGIDAS